MTQVEIEEQKEIEFYAASVAAWFNSALELDKSILTLSAAGIGVLITLLTTIGLNSAEALVLYFCAIICFLVALISILIVLQRNKTYIYEILSAKNTGNDPVLSKLDAIAKWAFGLGVVFTAIIGISTAIHSYTTKEKVMANKIEEKQIGASSYNGASSLIESFNDADKLRPKLASKSIEDSGHKPATVNNSNPQKQSNKKK